MPVRDLFAYRAAVKSIIASGVGVSIWTGRCSHWMPTAVTDRPLR